MNVTRKKPRYTLLNIIDNGVDLLFSIFFFFVNIYFHASRTSDHYPRDVRARAMEIYH